jgi:CO dehydrogenase nickel-insertion accessory protein CooC1
LWTPPILEPRDLSGLLGHAKGQTAGRVDVLLLELDASFLEHAGGLAIGIDYAVVMAEATPDAQNAADHIAERLGDAPPPHGKVGVVFSRVSASQAGELPEQTENRKLPVIGHYPADYLLAAGDDYSLNGGEPSWPHDKYIFAILRLARLLVRRVSLRRTPPKVTSADPGMAEEVARGRDAQLGA